MAKLYQEEEMTQAQQTTIRQTWLWIATAVLAIASVSILSPFMLALCMGAMFAVALVPMESKLRRRFHFGRGLSSTLTTLTFLIVILIPIIFVAFKTVTYVQKFPDLLEKINGMQKQVVPYISEKSQTFGFTLDSQAITKYYTSAANSLWKLVSESATGFVSNLPETMVHFTIMILTIWVVLFKHRRLMKKSLALGFVSRESLAKLSKIVSDTCHDVVFSNVITGIAQATMVAVGALVLTEYDPFLIFIVTFIVSFVPVIGAGPVAALLGIFEMFSGDLVGGVILFALTFVVGISDNIIRAWLMSSNGEDDAYLNLLAVIGGIYLWGLPGVFMGPLVVSISMKAMPLLLKEILKITPRRRTLVVAEKIPAK